jgi:signal transduction histidine kinase
MTSDTALLDHLERLEVSIRTIGKLVQFTRDFKDLGINPPQWFAIRDIIKGIPDIVDPAGISFRFDVGRWEIYADPQITRVFTNIAENTRLHGKRATELFVACAQNGQDLSLIIEDNGSGIPEEMKKEIFEPGMVRNRGFGLFLAREILSITGLTIEENGKEGTGARFEIRIPLGSYRMPTVRTDGSRSKTEVVP